MYDTVKEMLRCSHDKFEPTLEKTVFELYGGITNSFLVYLPFCTCTVNLCVFRTVADHCCMFSFAMLMHPCLLKIST